MNFYFIGIKGTGMSALACYLSDLGHNIKGCDVTRYIFTQKTLDEHFIPYEDYENMDYQNFEYIVLGNAFKSNHLIQQLKKDNKTILTYQQILSQLSDNHRSIAVCGTHGKTTTTHMIKQLFSEHMCSYIIGDGIGKGINNPEYFVFEACEYQDNFLNYHPNIVVLTNIDFDHVDYFKNQEQYNHSFLSFLNNTKDFVVLNQDDAYSHAIQHFISAPVYTYGIDSNCNIRAIDITYSVNGVYFSIKFNDEIFSGLSLPIYGKHLFYDALASIAVGLILGESIDKIIDNLNQFKPAKRRFNVLEINSNVIVDDYGHHPDEINKTLESIKQKYPSKSIQIIFHPDRSSRIAYFFSRYISIFKQFEKVYIIPFIGTKQGSDEEQLINDFVKIPNITILNDELFEKTYKNTVFLFTGSKDMTGHIKRLSETL